MSEPGVGIQSFRKVSPIFSQKKSTNMTSCSARAAKMPFNCRNDGRRQLQHPMRNLSAGKAKSKSALRADFN